MDTSTHDTDRFPYDALRLHEQALRAFGEAAMVVDRPLPFDFECILGYPFVWVLHPGLDAGAMVAAYADLVFLDHLGYITLRFSDRAQTGSFTLTAAGLAHCAELEVFQA